MSDPIRVLFVDDQVYAREWLAEKLRRTYHFEVKCASNSEEALACVVAAQQHYDVALIDLELEARRDGIELMKQIRASHPEMEIIIITGYGDVEDGLRAMQEGACNYVLKPLREEELVVYIRAAAERRRLKRVELERDWLKNLISVSQATVGPLDPEQIAQEICQRIASLIPDLKLFYIASYDNKRDEIKFLGAIGKEGKIEFAPRRLAAGGDIGLAGYVVKKRMPLIAEDIEDSELVLSIRSNSVSKPTRACISLPLVSRDKIIGVLSAQSDQPKVFTLGHQRLLQAIANQTAVAIDNAIQHQHITRQLEILSRLYTTLAKLRTALNLTDVLDLIIDNLSELFTLDTCTVGLFDEDFKTVEFRAGRGLGGRTRWRLNDLPIDIQKLASAPNSAMIVIHLDQRPDLRAHLVHPELKSFGLLLLCGKNRPLGVVTMGSKGVLEFSEEEQGLLLALADQATIAIENARLHEETQAWAQQLERLDQTARDIANEKEIGKLLRTVANKACEFLDAAGSGVYLLTTDSQEFRLEAATGQISDLEGKTFPVNKGVIGKALNAKKPFRVDNYAQWPDRLEILEKKIQTAVLGVPIFSDAAFLGVLLVYDTNQKRVFNKGDEDLLSRLGRLAGSEIEKAKLLQERDATSDLAQVLVSELRYDQLPKTILDNLSRRFNYTTCAIFLKDTKTNALHIQAAIGYSEDMIRTRRINIANGVGLTAWVAREGKPKIVPDVDKETLYIRSVSSSRSEIAVPLIYRGKTFGVLNVESPDVNAFNERDERILSQAAATIAIAIKNAQFFDRMRKKSKALSRLQHAVRVVNSTLDMDDVLENVLAQLKRILPYDSASIQLKVGDVFKVIACDGLEGPVKNKTLQQQFPIDPRFPSYEIASAKLPLLIPDVRRSKYPHFSQQADEFHTKHVCTWLGVPLLQDQELIGMLTVDNKQPNAYNEEDKKQCLAFADQVASAIANALAYKNAQNLNLLGTVQDIKQRFNLQAVLKRIVDGAVDKNGGIGADIAIIYPFNPDTGVIDEKPVHAGLLRDEGINFQPDFRDSVVYRILNLMKLHSADDVRGDAILDPGFVERDDYNSTAKFPPRFVEREGIASAAGVPLRVGDEPVGVMFINYLSRHAFTESDLTWINIFAQQAAIAIQTARQFQRLESASNAAVSLAAMSAWAHDAANETYSLRADAQSLTKRLEGLPDLSPKVTETLTRIRNTAERVATLIPDMLSDFSEKHSVPLATILREAAARRESDLRQRQIVVDISLDSMPPVLANKELLEMVADHLIQNAIKALPKGGQLTFSYYIAAARAYVRVTDTGEGVPHDIQAQLFLRRVPSANRGGNGMGLLLTRMYLFACGGDIRLDRSDANGTTFIFHLPLAELTNGGDA